MVALMFVTSSGIANEGKLSLETKTESRSLVFKLDAQASETNIKLFDSDDHIIYSENISNSSYAKKFDLTNLAEGLYFFTTEDSLKKITYVIEVIGAEVNILKKKENAKPVFRKKNGIVYLNLLNLDKKSVTIEVFDSSDRLVFQKSVKTR